MKEYTKINKSVNEETNKYMKNKYNIDNQKRIK